jgi:hypothetical protein
MTRQFVLLGLALGLFESLASAEAPSQSISSFDPDASTAPIDMVEGRGVKIGESTTLHPAIGMQTGVLSNVFYEESAADPNAAGVLRLLGQVGMGSLSGLRLVPAEVGGDGGEGQAHRGSFEYRAEVRLAYDLMLSGNDAVQGSGGLGVGATFRGMTNPDGAWSFGFNDTFSRLIRAANFETDANTDRDINNLSLNVLFHPQGRSLAVNLYYNNTLDIFERSEQDFADRQMHRFGLKPMWRWLPETVVYADLSWGVTAGLGSSAMKSTSYPLNLSAGVATLLSAKTTLNFQAGYVNGFYSAGPSYSGVNVSAQIGYRYSPLGRLAVAYDLVHQDSVNANFFRDHVIRMNVQQLFVPFVLMVQPELHFRRYEGVTLVAGPPTRDDVIFSLIAGIHYNFRNSLAATLDYHFSAVSTDYRYMVDMMVDDPSFARHQLLAGVRWAL